MLDGKKSYLISITALFSKKGYELAIGTDTIFDTQRDTRYHLSAPVNSTYRTLKEDTLKNASKAPYSATSILGRDWKEAEIASEIEGQSVEAVHTTIVSYLSDIHRHFSGEIRQGAQQPSHSLKPDASWRTGNQSDQISHADSIKEGQQNPTIQADLSFNVEQEQGTDSKIRKYIENSISLYEYGKISNILDGIPDKLLASEQDIRKGIHFSESAILGENVKRGDSIERHSIIHHLFQDRKAITEEQATAELFDNDVLSQHASQSLRYITDTREILVEASESGVKEQIFDISETSCFEEAGKLENLNDLFVDNLLVTEVRVKDDVIPEKVQTVEPRQRDEAIITQQKYVRQRKDFKDSANEQSAAAYMYSAKDTEYEQVSASTWNDSLPITVQESSKVDHLYRQDGMQPQGMLIVNQNVSSIELENVESTIAEAWRGILVQSPELSKMAQELSELYGEQIMEQLETEMKDDLLECLQQDSVQAISSLIRESMVYRMQEVLNGSSIEGIQSYPVVVRIEQGANTIRVQAETATSDSSSPNNYSLIEPVGVNAYKHEQAHHAALNQYRAASPYQRSRILQEEQSSTGDSYSSTEIIYEHMSSGIIENYTDTNLDDSMPAEFIYVGEGEEFKKISFSDFSEPHLEGQQGESFTAEILREMIGESPEISRMSRMIRIMYGEQAMELIKVGIENIVTEAAKEGTVQAVSALITNNVIHQLEKALDSRSVDAVSIQSDRGNREHSGGALETNAEKGLKTFIEDGQLLVSEWGSYSATEEGIHHTMDHAERHMSTEADVQAVSNALVSSDITHVMLHSMENGSIFFNYRGATGSMEQGISQSVTEGEFSGLENSTNTSIPDADRTEALESGKYIQQLETEEAATVESEYRKNMGVWRHDIEEGKLSEWISGVDKSLLERASDHSTTQTGTTLNGTLADNHMHAFESIHLHGEQATHEPIQETITDWVNQANSVSLNEALIEQVNGQSNAENMLEAIQDEEEGFSGDNVYTGGRDNFEAADIADINRIVDIQEQIQGGSDAGTIQSLMAEDIEAESILKTDGAEIDGPSEGTRKKKVISIKIEDDQEAFRKKKLLKTQTIDAKEGTRSKKTVPVHMESSESATRHKILKTVIESPSEGTNETIPVMPKRKIWMIMGKIASWNIWNWKKTR